MIPQSTNLGNALRYDVQISYDDYKAAKKLHSRPRPGFQVVVYFFQIIFIWACCLAVLNFYKGRMDAVSLIIPGIGLFLFLQFRLLAPIAWRSAYRRNKLLGGPAHLEFTPETFHVSSEFTEMTVPWEKIHKWREGKESFLLYISDNNCQVVPKRVFADQKEIDDIRVLLTEKLGKSWG